MLIDYNSKNSVTITCKSNEKIQIVHTATGLFVSKISKLEAKVKGG